MDYLVVLRLGHQALPGVQDYIPYLLGFKKYIANNGNLHRHTNQKPVLQFMSVQYCTCLWLFFTLY